MKWTTLTRETLFQSGHLTRDLSRKSVRGGMVTLGSQAVQFLLRIASTVVLARLLTPVDYGLVGMVTVVVNFAAMFKTAGLSMATVQREEITHEQISTLFWLNVLISVGLGLCILAASPLIGWFYSKPELTTVTAALSLSFILSGLTIQHQALQRRHMRFGTLASIQIVSQIITLIVTIGLALLGWRYWALVGGTLANALAGSLLTFLFCPWIPGRMHRGTGVRNMLKFGGHVTAFNFINYFSRNADNILIGRFIGADALGLYSRAYNLFLMPISQIRSPINDVSVPALCAIRNDHESYRNYYRKIIFIIAALSMPLVGFMLVFANNIILLMLGKQWLGAVDVFQVLAAVGFIQAAVQAGTALPLLSMGFSRRYFHFGIVQSVVTVLGIVVGLHWGIVGVAAGYGISFCLLIPFTVAWCLKGTPVTIRDGMLAIYSPALATLIMVAFMIWLKGLVLHDVNVFDLSLYANLRVIILSGIAGMTIYGLAVLSIPMGRESVFGVAKQFRRNVRGHKVSMAS
ncbi:lipopolysaccharide biosynthesis protein [Desulforhabdus sp. TSK]|uniref:lipopolysaccharide biosynthesis protein n=1 Tax=Desulforhabdus sp. TSK TaxID=2925014 RepID=UPI001FC80DB1|nr:lipopolysaccharide biosynthesis protein [Desulforhabdus sp. TSK]GKT08607.1 lipopolysaccharide biosynthesis protein [Desulforhabdus sp. TSK]